MALKLAHLTSEEITDIASDAIVVVPVGSTEQHGPHLPMLTDSLLVESVLDKAMELLDSGKATYIVTPTIPVGCSDHHLFAAALSVRVDTMRAMLADLCDSLVCSGFRRLALINGHGGNDECIGLAVKELVLRHSVVAGACSYWETAPVDADHVDKVPGHAGWFETSLMLSAHPGLVRVDKLTTQSPEPPPVFNQREARGFVTQRAQEWSRVGGSTDPAHEASASDGERLLRTFARGLADALAWFSSHEPPTIDADLPPIRK